MALKEKNKNQRRIPRKPIKMEVLVAGAETQALVVDTLGIHHSEKLRNILEMLGWSERQLCIKTRLLPK